MFFNVKIQNRKDVILKTGLVVVTVLFITCLYLLNPCDISAYTCLVEAVGVFWRAE